MEEQTHKLPPVGVEVLLHRLAQKDITLPMSEATASRVKACFAELAVKGLISHETYENECRRVDAQTLDDATMELFRAAVAHGAEGR